MLYAYTKKHIENFYEWEKKYRGNIISNDLQSIEPKFKPFQRHKSLQSLADDDGRAPSFFNRLANSTKSFLAQFERDSINEIEDKTKPLINPMPLICLKITAPRDASIHQHELEQLLLVFSQLKYQISFEVIATNKLIQIQFVCLKTSALFITNQIKAHFSHIIIDEIDDILASALDESQTVIIDLGLQNEFILPLQMNKNIDTFVALFAVFENLIEDEFVVIQILFKHSKASWSESVTKSVTNEHGEPYFANASEMLAGSKSKIESPLFGVIVRVIAKSENYLRSKQLSSATNEILIQCSATKDNSLLNLSNDNYDFNIHAHDVVTRQSHRMPMVLNAKELIGFVHFPTAAVKSDKYQLSSKKQKRVTQNCLHNYFYIGDNVYNNSSQKITLNPTQRSRHTAIMGGSGVGKSNLLLHMIIQDMNAGNGVMVMDSHGLIDSVLKYIPKARFKDVIVINPGDEDYSVALNMLKCFSPVEKDVLASDLVAAFKRNSLSWGDSLNAIFSQAVQAIINSSVGGTLLDLKRFLLEQKFRIKYLESIDDISTQYFWKHEFPLLRTTSTASILTRLDTFLRPRPIRNMVLQNASLNFQDIINSKKILLVKLPIGLIGAENSHLLGTLIASKIYQAALARTQNINQDNYYVYIDEFHNFLTPTISDILSGARQFHLSLILANQSLSQISDPGILESIASNANVRICFRLSSSDAKKMNEQFTSFDESDFQRLNVGEAIMKVDGAQFDFTLNTKQVISNENSKEEIQEILDYSRHVYAKPTTLVETSLAAQFETITSENYTISDNNLKNHLEKKNSETTKRLDNSINSKSIDDLSLKKERVTSEHRYLQNMIKRVAESKGYVATIESQLSNGGCVDVLLENKAQKIGIEISATTNESWELHNLHKCLDSNLDSIIMCLTEAAKKKKLQTLIHKEVDSKYFSKVIVLTTTELFANFDTTIPTPETKNKTTKGYRIKVTHDTISDSESTQKKESIFKILLSSKKEKPQK